MKKLLILAYDFPPYVSVGGLRPKAWHRYLSDYEVYPIVVTRQWGNKYGNELDYIAPSDSDETLFEHSDNGLIIRAAYRPNLANRLLLKYGASRFVLLRKAITAYYEYAQFVYTTGTKSELYACAHQYLLNNKVDAIIATGEPFVLFRYAHMLSEEFGIPWIADYRDPWSHNNKRSSNLVSKFWNRYNERRLLRSVSAITTVSQFFVNQIQELAPDKPFHIVTNGYDPDAIASAEGIEQNKDVLSIAFVGTIYPWHPLESFIRTCDRFLSATGKTLAVHFYGINAEVQLNALLDQYPMAKNSVVIFPKMDNVALLKRLATYNVFLLFNYYSFIGTKIYDYLALKRRIILCYTDDPESIQLKTKFYPLQDKYSTSETQQADVLEQTNAGTVIKNSQHLFDELMRLSAEFLDQRRITCNTSGYEVYSRSEQCKRLSSIVNSIIH